MLLMLDEIILHENSSLTSTCNEETVWPLGNEAKREWDDSSF